MTEQTIFSASTNVEISHKDMKNFFRIMNTPEGKILDVGCRTGEFVEFLTGEKRSVIGIDLDASCIDVAKKKYPQLKENFFAISILDIDIFFKEKFDRVYCIGVMNYLPQRQWHIALKKMIKVLSTEGDIIVTFTNPSLLGAFIKILRCVPQKIYVRYVAPVITSLLYPVQHKLLSDPVSREHFHYKFSLSLYGLNLGFPQELEKYRINIDHTPIVSNKTAVFRIPSGTILN